MTKLYHLFNHYVLYSIHDCSMILKYDWYKGFLLCRATKMRRLKPKSELYYTQVNKAYAFTSFDDICLVSCNSNDRVCQS